MRVGAKVGSKVGQVLNKLLLNFQILPNLVALYSTTPSHRKIMVGCFTS